MILLGQLYQTCRESDAGDSVAYVSPTWRSISFTQRGYGRVRKGTHRCVPALFFEEPTCARLGLIAATVFERAFLGVGGSTAIDHLHASTLHVVPVGSPQKYPATGSTCVTLRHAIIGCCLRSIGVPYIKLMKSFSVVCGAQESQTSNK